MCLVLVHGTGPFCPSALSCLSLLDFWVCPNVEYTLLGIPINYITPKLLFEMGHGWPVTNNQGLSALLLGRSSSLQWFTTGWDWLHHQFRWWSDSCILKFYDCMTISCAFSSRMRLITCPLLWGWIPILLLCQSLPSPCWRWTTTVAVVSPRWSWDYFWFTNRFTNILPFIDVYWRWFTIGYTKMKLHCHDKHEVCHQTKAQT